MLTEGNQPEEVKHLETAVKFRRLHPKASDEKIDPLISGKLSSSLFILIKVK